MGDLDDQFLGERLRMKSVFSLSALSWQRHGENTTTTGMLNGLIDDTRSLKRIGVRQDWTFDATPTLLFKWGVDAKRETATYDYFRVLGPPKRDGSPRIGRDSMSTLTAPRADKVALYFAPRVQILPSLTIEAGARYDRSSVTDESIVSPRLNVSWQPYERTAVRAAWGQYSQSQSLFSLQAEDGVNTFGRAERAEQRTLGVEQSFTNGVTARVEVYERRLTNARAKYMNLGGDLWLFPELLWDRKLIERTAGRDRGLELQMARSGGRAHRLVGELRARVVDGPDGRPDGAAELRRTARGARRLVAAPSEQSWRLSLGGLWHSGWPYTPTHPQGGHGHQQPEGARHHHLAHARRRSTRCACGRTIEWTSDGRSTSTPRRAASSVFGEVYNLFGTGTRAASGATRQ